MKEEKLLNLAEISKKEGKHIDFKETFDSSSVLNWCEIIKDIIAMANSGGGIILFGVKDNGTLCTFDKNIILNIDPATISDKIQSYTNENFSEFKISEIRIKNRLIASFIISETPIPVVFTRNGADNIIKNKHRPAFIKGSVYFRHGAKSEPGDTNDIRQSIDRTVNNIRKSWFDGVRKISNIKTNEEVIVKIKDSKNIVEQKISVGELQKIAEQGRPIEITLKQFKTLEDDYPLDYKEVIKLCKKKKFSTQKELQLYINKCKTDQNLSINWRIICKSLKLPFNAPDKYTYKKSVVEGWSGQVYID
jgi:predicted HTH transcriptional regulator